MIDFLQSAGSLAAACTILGYIFMWMFCTRHWTHGGDIATYSRMLATFVHLFFSAAPILLWAGAGEGASPWSLPEAAAASLTTWVILALHKRHAKRALMARISAQKKRR